MSTALQSGNRVPVIFIESENDIRTLAGSSGEIRKLCCHAAPLKVLLTVGSWDEAPNVWKGRSVRDACLASCKRIIKDHTLVWPHRGLFGLIVGEWFDLSDEKGRLRFYTNTIEADGAVINHGQDRILVERELQESLASHQASCHACFELAPGQWQLCARGELLNRRGN